MKEKLMNIWAKVQPVLAKAYSISPFAAGMVVGYFGKPVISAAIKLGAGLVKWLLS